MTGIFGNNRIRPHLPIAQQTRDQLLWKGSKSPDIRVIDICTQNK
jgi:hypothetical protein